VRLSTGGQPWPSSRSINGGMASLQERKGREGEGHGWGTTWGEGGLQRECHGGLALHATMSLLFVRMQLLLLA
jgi:hypothetical protein